jgi:hypothetical protein
MAKFNIQIEVGPTKLPIKLTVEGSLPESRLKETMLSQTGTSSIGAEIRSAAYQIICLRTGRILSEDTAQISSWIRDNDSFLVREILAHSDNNLSKEEVLKIKSGLQNTIENKIIPPQDFSVTGIKPRYLDFATEYPVLAINVRYIRTDSSRAMSQYRWLKDPKTSYGGRQIYAKYTSFLIADKAFRFKWVSPSESNFYRPELAALSPDQQKKQRTRYSFNKDIGECKNMIYPVRAFSITGISMEGFDSAKAYPVLAIDMDQYLSENTANEEGESTDEQASQTMAFFLVGDENGEFAWIAEDECRLYPL